MIHAFQFQDLYLALDVESGAVHLLDKQAYDVVVAMQDGDPYALPYPRQEIKEILEEIDILCQSGAFHAPEKTPPMGKESEPVIKSMCLNVAHDCNLRCKYCFADTGEYQGGRALMPEEVGYAALEFLMERSGKRHTLEVDFFGGEPLVNYLVVQNVVRYGRELEKRYNKHINFTCTTNALSLSEEKMEFLNREMHNLVLSLDGRKEVHDAMRPTAGGEGSYDAIVSKIQELIRHRGDKEYYIRGTFTSRNLDFTEDVKSLLELGFAQLSLEPVVLPEESPYAIREADLPRVMEEYDRLADLVLESRRKGRWFNFFHFMVDFDSGPCLKKRVKGCGAGTEYVAVTPNGDIYPCHQFVGETAYCMGNVLKATLDTDLQSQFLGCNILTKPMCRACWCKYFCSGGCAANAYKYKGSIHEPYDITCSFTKKRVECAIGIYAKEKEAKEKERITCDAAV